MTSDGFKTIARRAPGRNSWRCPHCSKKEPFKSEPWGGYFNGAQACQCKQCGFTATKNCTRYGTNGKDGGKWAPWDPSNPPKTLTKPAAPGRRPPGSPPPFPPDDRMTCSLIMVISQ